MPRFVIDPEERSSPAEANDSMVPMPRPSRSASLRSPSFTGSLSCLAPDGRTVYSLSLDHDAFIDAHHLPLEGSTEDEIERDNPAIIRTKLPPSVFASLQVDAPVELFCAHSDTMPRLPRDANSSRPQKCLFPILCLYTRHSVFLLQLAFSFPFVKEIVGEVISVTEPLEAHLVSLSTSTYIVRVRPAPQPRMGFATLCPPGSVAVLTRDADVNNYVLALYHGPHEGRPDGWVSTELEFGLEYLVDDEEITDFCFAQSNGQPLLATMSVHLLKASGDVLGASPILFDGAVVQRSFVRDAQQFLHYLMENGANESRRLQSAAAHQYILDAFGSDDERPFVTARTSIGAVTNNSLLWPKTVQGPILVSSIDPEECNRALVIEPFFARDLVGMAIGRERVAVDFAAIPATGVLPRFKYMDDRDQEDVDYMLAGLGIVVERLIVDCSGEEEAHDSGLTTLVRDPIVDNMIHYAFTRGIISITTNSMRLYSNKIREEALGGDGFMSPPTSGKGDAVRSTAWSSLDVSAGDDHISLKGAVVSGDALLGHSLVASLSDGSPVAVNLTESRYLHEAESMIRAKDSLEQDETSRVVKDALSAMESTPPLHELLSPLLDQIDQGLRGMGKIVGAKTAPKDITPALLATVISVKERCEKEIVLPLQEMDQLAASRLKELKAMHKSQSQQVSALKETIQLLKDRMKVTNEQMQVAQSNATLLAQRSAALLQVSHDLSPTVTKAERAYYDLLRRVKAKCDKWEEAIGTVQKDSLNLFEAIDAGRATAAVKLEPEEEETCRTVLRGEELSLKTSSEMLDQTKRNLNAIVAATGIGVGNENISPPNSSGQ